MEETFGPVVGIMKVEGDEEALQLMNDSPYGLVRHPIFTLTTADSIDCISMDKPR
jgi:acyl-CoA reductase-like NAD-dependent aldehyde dehydrogenase